MNRMTLLRSSVLAALLALAAIPALAQPVITNVTPGITPANTGMLARRPPKSFKPRAPPLRDSRMATPKNRAEAMMP